MGQLATEQQTRTNKIITLSLTIGTCGAFLVALLLSVVFDNEQPSSSSTAPVRQTRQTAISATTLRTATIENGRIVSLKYEPLRSIVSTNSTATTSTDYRLKSQGYIIKFTDAPLITKRQEFRQAGLQNSALNTAVSGYAAILRASQDKTLAEVAALFGKSLSLLVTTRYTLGFNGAVINNVAAAEIKRIEKMPGIDYVVPNYAVQALQTQVEVDPVENFVLPSEINLPGYDGAGITIAIFDTGIDYNHPDFGSCLLPPKTFDCFPERPISYGSCTDSDGGRNLCQAGHTTYMSYGYMQEIGDYCERNRGTSALYEYGCAYNGSLTRTLVQCPNGCLDGQCIEPDNILTPQNCPKVSTGYDFVTCAESDWFGECAFPKFDDPDPRDDNGHGTHVASIAAGSGDIKGVAPAANLQAYKVLNSQGWGLFSWILSGIERALDPNQDGDFSDRADIFNFSFGGAVDDPGRNPLTNAVDAAVADGVVAVAAAGNNGVYKAINSPGDATDAITVGASDGLSVTSFSSRGPVNRAEFAPKPDVVAPGINVCAAQHGLFNQSAECIDNQHTALSGTSMATPHVAGAAALLLQANPSLTPAQLKSRLVLTGTPTTTEKYAGHASDYLEWAYQQTSSEVCTKLSVAVPISNASIYYAMPQQKTKPRNALIRNDQAGSPGGIRQQFTYSRQTELNGYLFYLADLPSLPSGSYWLCSAYDTELPLAIHDFGQWQTDLIFNSTTGTFEPPRNSYNEPTMMSMILAVVYGIPSTGLESGGGRINLSGAVTAPIDVSPTALGFGVASETGNVERDFTITRNDSGQNPVIGAETSRRIADLYRRDLISLEEYKYVSINKIDDRTYRASLSVPADAAVGHYAGMISISTSQGIYRMPYSFVVVRERVLDVPSSTDIPTIDGQLNFTEWKDALQINISNTEDLGKMYFKAGRYNGVDSLLIGVNHRGQYDVPRNACADFESSFFFDEGDDGSFGSGSYDRQLLFTQEDWKMGLMAVCDVNDREQVQYTYRMDGWYASGWGAWNPDYFDPALGDFAIQQTIDQNGVNIEMAIPFQGIDLGEVIGDDVGDLRVSYGDTISFLAVFYYPFTSLVNTYYPSDGSMWNSETFSTKLHLANCPDGTKPFSCSAAKPLYCASNTLTANCKTCGCPAGQTCLATGKCTNIGSRAPIRYTN